MIRRDEITSLLKSKYRWLALLLFLTDLLVIALLVDMLTACSHHDICFHHEHVVKLRVAFDWRDAPEAHPQGMVVFFYPEEECRGGETDNGNGTIRLDLRGRDGAEISIPAGKYRIVAYNNDTEVCFGHLTDYWRTHHLRTRHADILELAGGMGVRGADTPRPEGTQDEPVVLPPDGVWGCNATEVSVSAQGISYKCFPLEEKEEWIVLPPTVTENVITLYPRDLLCRYSYEVRNVKGLQGVTDLCAGITGMSPTFHLGDMTRSGEPSTLPLPAQKDGSTTIRGEFLTFGHPEGDAGRHRFALYVWDANRRTYFLGKDEPQMDVTLQVDTAPDPRRVHLVIDSLDLGLIIEDKESGGGFNPEFGNWNEENHKVIL